MENEPTIDAPRAGDAPGFPSDSFLLRLYAAGAILSIALGFLPMISRSQSKLCFFVACLLAVGGSILSYCLEREDADA